MRVLVDTQALIWAVDDRSKLSVRAIDAMQDPENELFISAATVWELAIKVGLGKLRLSSPYRAWTETALADLKASIFQITVEYCEVQADLPRHHGDPFDRMIVAQAIREGVPIISKDQGLDAYGVDRLW